ncbi:hypothetical protein B0O80DRAFT_427701 [Mortierella sp. GBAus27b]|nr:hypothetical protein B0O80DRAFT_427701 [Mortierella sp. GBAus27b]
MSHPQVLFTSVDLKDQCKPPSSAAPPAPALVRGNAARRGVHSPTALIGAKPTHPSVESQPSQTGDRYTYRDDSPIRRYRGGRWDPETTAQDPSVDKETSLAGPSIDHIMDTPADSSRDTHTQLSAIDLSTSSQQREGSPEVTSLSQLPEGISLSQFPEVASLSQLPEATSLSQLQSGQRLPTTPPSMESVCDSPESESEYYSFNDEPDSIDNIPSDVVQAQDTASSTSRAAQDPHELIVMSSVTPVDLPVCGNTPEGIAHSRVDDSIASRTRSSDGKTTSKDNTSGHSRRQSYRQQFNGSKKLPGERRRVHERRWWRRRLQGP